MFWLFTEVLLGGSIAHPGFTARGVLDPEQRDSVEQGIRDIVEDFSTRPTSESQLPADKMAAEHSPPSVPAPAWRLYCLPARAERDDHAWDLARAIASAARPRGAERTGETRSREMVKLVDEADVEVIHARYLCVKLRAQPPNLKIAIRLCGATENITQVAQRLRDSGANEVVTTLADAVVQLAKRTPARDVEMTPAPIPPINTVDSSASRS